MHQPTIKHPNMDPESDEEEEEHEEEEKEDWFVSNCVGIRSPVLLI